MKYRNVIIIGATSGIGRALAYKLANRNYTLILLARDIEELQRIAADLKIRYHNKNRVYPLDIESIESTKTILNNVIKENNDIDELYFLIGYLGEQKVAQKDWSEREKILNINYKMAVHVLSEFANFFEQRKRGKMIIVGSVAGDRGRQSNYLYGSAKAGLHAFAQGLRSRLIKSNVHVMTVKPGFVDTAMTYGLPGLFYVQAPEETAKKIIKSVEKEKNTIYVPYFWRYIMCIVKNIPESLFKRLSF